MTTKPEPVALGFTPGLTPIEELVARVAAGHHNYAIMLAGGAAISRKTIRYQPRAQKWTVVNHIDGSTQTFITDAPLWESSHIGEALDKRALLDLDGDMLYNIDGRGPVLASVFDAEERAKAADANVTYRAERERQRAEEPLVFRLSGAPGAIRMGEDADVEWEPANPSLVLEVCEIGPSTVAQIDLAAVCMGFLDPARDGSEDCRHAATTSIELTIEDIDALIETLTAIRADAISRRGFAIRADGWWTNGEE